MENFLAIDFETANAQRGSACALGWAQFQAGRLFDSGRLLINPQLSDEQWDAFNISIHGIKPEDVRGAPMFAEVWSIVAPHTAADPLVAHNASFDMSVLRAEFARWGMTPDPFRYVCSARLSRAAWPEMLSVSLPVVADELKIALDHHNPCSDATASGQILLAAVERIGVASIADALKKTGRQWGEVRPDLGWMPFGTGHTGVRAADMSANTNSFDKNHPLFGRVVAFTGALDSMTRREAFQVVLNAGGQPADGVTKATNILVCGEQDLGKLAAGATMSHKLQQATDLRIKGLDIELIGEVDFLRLL
jgi:DNA polymerase-3 subunit epsilon